MFSETAVPVHAMQQVTQFQQVPTFQELMKALQDGEKNILAFSMKPIDINDIQTLSNLLLQKITVMAPQPANQQLIENIKLRLDSR